MPTSMRTSKRTSNSTKPPSGKRAERRLRRKAEFDAVFREGERVASGVLSLSARAREDRDVSGTAAPDSRGPLVAPDGPCRFGFAISSRLGGAVVRNRIRRRLRASADRLNRDGECRGLDVVVVARGGAAEADFHTLDATLSRLVRRSMRIARDTQPEPDGGSEESSAAPDGFDSQEARGER
ncbi:MAG: ribonuclease P protein component [Chloroflexi bacterium]|nr:ribonuclease P protein component [Chloroflexota bacterium]MXX79728.1 ribonuclease P protein component [Chloroflexota bacterium]MYD17895.1 ribonuclease P protein component [Chloroflexota bacterium]MYF22272.1 ribonuclease P protein component [Chloroflexota bacterium]